MSSWLFGLPAFGAGRFPVDASQKLRMGGCRRLGADTREQILMVVGHHEVVYYLLPAPLARCLLKFRYVRGS